MKINGITVSGGGGSSPTLLSNQILASGSWAVSGSYFEYTFSNAGINTNTSVDITPYNDSISTTQDAGILPQIITVAGACKVYAQITPSTDIICDILITPTT